MCSAFQSCYERRRQNVFFSFFFLLACGFSFCLMCLLEGRQQGRGVSSTHQLSAGAARGEKPLFFSRQVGVFGRRRVKRTLWGTRAVSSTGAPALVTHGEGGDSAVDERKATRVFTCVDGGTGAWGRGGKQGEKKLSGKKAREVLCISH